MKMTDADRDALQITDSKIVQAKIDSQPREKALQAAAEEVSYGQLGIRQGSISEVNSEAIDPYARSPLCSPFPSGGG